MSGKDQVIQWTEDEDFYLSQGYSMCHDDKTNAIDFARIREIFPFKESRKVSDLAERWRFLTDHIETEDQDTIERIKTNASKFHRQTWGYRYEPEVDLPQVDEILEQYKQMPSLAMKTQFVENQSGRFAPDSQNINEMCLNNQFDVASVNRIVQEVLMKTVDDETLRGTLHLEFRKQLMIKGREIAIRDFSRKLGIINEMSDHVLADTEGKILVGQFERILTNVANRAKICAVGYYSTTDSLPDLLNILTRMQGIEWPLEPSTVIEAVRRDFKQLYFQVWAQILATQDPTKAHLIKPFVDSVLIWDRIGEFEMHVNDQRVKQIIASFRRQITW